MLAHTFERSPAVAATLAELEQIRDPHTRALSAAAVVNSARADTERLRPRIYRAAIAARLTEHTPALEVARLAGFNRQYLHRLTSKAKADGKVPRVRAATKKLQELHDRVVDLAQLEAGAEQVRTAALEELLTAGRVGPSGIPVSAFAEQIGVTRQRVYQIRDELRAREAS
jgi:hypothetical protein